MRWMILCTAFVVITPAMGQVRTAKGGGLPKAAAGPTAAFNSAAKDTTPLNCKQYRNHPHPMMVGFCQSIEDMTLQNEASRAGRPAPSRSVIVLPGLGSTEAKQLGYACVGGQAFRRLPNGWQQVHAPDGGWQRCEEQD